VFIYGNLVTVAVEMHAILRFADPEGVEHNSPGQRPGEQRADKKYTPASSPDSSGILPTARRQI